jgi:hypothetical protein
MSARLPQSLLLTLHALLQVLYGRVLPGIGLLGVQNIVQSGEGGG